MMLVSPAQDLRPKPEFANDQVHGSDPTLHPKTLKSSGEDKLLQKYEIVH